LDVLNALLPGVLCNDSTLLVEADRDLAPAPTDVTSAGDIELAGTEASADKPSATENDKLALEAGGQGWAVEGDPTERCIVELAALSDAPQAIKQLMIRNPRLAEVPFDSATKYMATIHSLSPELLEGLRATGYTAELPTGNYLRGCARSGGFSYLLCRRHYRRGGQGGVREGRAREGAVVLLR
jgi:magnesium-transporting ATPase (P-type)